MKSLDEVFGLFKSERRRFALYYLDTADGPVPIDELAKKIYEWENDPSETDIPDDAYEDVVLSLRHNHLPQIEDASHIEFDATSQQLRISGMSSEADVILSVTKAIEKPGESTDFIRDRFGNP